MTTPGSLTATLREPPRSLLWRDISHACKKSAARRGRAINYYERHEISTELRVTRNTSVLLEVWRGNDSVLSQSLGPHVPPRGSTTGSSLTPLSLARPIGRAVGTRARAALVWREIKRLGEGSRFTPGWGVGARARQYITRSSDVASELRLNANIYCNHAFAVARYTLRPGRVLWTRIMRFFNISGYLHRTREIDRNFARAI